MLRPNRLPCLVWNGTGKHLRSQVGSRNHGQVPVIWKSPSFGAVDHKNVRPRLAHTGITASGICTPIVPLVVRARAGDQWRNPWVVAFLEYISVRCSANNRITKKLPGW